MKGLRHSSRRIALVLVVVMFHQCIAPTVILALTSGPTQPEASSFTPAGTNDMVDLFSGDFSYNIPLLDVGGYPINISYAAEPGMDEEASWVGLGWNLSPGVINRQMRGLPDDFSGDSITKSFSIRPDVTTGITLGGGIEIKGIPFGLSASTGMYYNTYKGYGLTHGISPTFSIGDANKSSLTAGLGINYDSQKGLEITPTIGLTGSTGILHNRLSASTGFNSIRGLRDLSISYNFNISGMSALVNNLLGLATIGTNISFNGSTYTPTSDLPLKNSSVTFHGTVGGEYALINPHGSVEGYRSAQKLLFNKQKQSAFGYLHSQNAKNYDLLDFNRERNGLPWRQHMPVLPPGFGTYDLFAASGQGSVGQFRAIRNDIGFYQDAFHRNPSDSKSLGVELALGNAFKAGIDFNITTVEAFKEGWKKNNALATSNKYSNWDGRSAYEPVFFKSAGEPNVTEVTDDFLSTIGNFNPIQANLDLKTGAIRPSFQRSSNQKPIGVKTFSSSSNIKRPTREKRNEVWQYLTSREAERYALEIGIPSYHKNQIRIDIEDETCAVDTLLSRTRFGARHISEVTIVKPGGSRYVYGIPAYNTSQKEVSFSVNGNLPEDSTGLIRYEANKDNSLKNNKGRDAYYNAEEIPPYAYAYLLTGVLSPDYIDRTGNGITYDDYGTAVRLNYSRAIEQFHWRTPFGKSPDSVFAVARYFPGRKSDANDNKASYIYGTKEVWYVHSIESATMVAQFYTSNRNDALGVGGENGGLDTLSRLQKLDSIKLFSKADLIAYGDSAIAIKTVNFEYDYSLCPGTPNSIADDNGKLTLKKIWFTYGKSGRGVLNAYSFSYNDRPYAAAHESTKYKYNMAYVDRWGNYKKNPTDYPDNSYYPYALQDESLVFPGSSLAMIHHYAGAWSLRKIELPSGGSIEVEYEADDYAYVQNQRAGQMFFIRGFSTTNAPTTITNQLYDSDEEGDMGKYVWVDIAALYLPDNTLPDSNAFKARCLEGINNIWFHADVKLDGDARENITGYMQYDPSTRLRIGCVVNGNLTTVGIPIKLVDSDNHKKINPITKASLQMMRLELPDLVYPGTEASTGIESAIKLMVGLAATIGNIFRGFEINKIHANKAKEAGVTQDSYKTSWLRLCNPRYKKFGGGHRVKQITLKDNWDAMTGKPGAIYGQRYSYTTQKKVIIGGEEEVINISSGVASWEPTIGSEENLWKQPVNFNDKIKLAPDNSYYVETPFGESLFPAAMVGYSTVTVENLAYRSNSRMGAGWMVHEFYTAQDFPTLVDYSAPMRFHDKGHKLKRIFKIRAKDFLSLTQGFVVEVNDMHGKPKQESSFAQNGSLISRTRFDYKVDHLTAQKLHLNNKVKVVTPEGDIGSERYLGLDVEVWNDFREESTITRGAGGAFNTDGFYAFIPLILFTLKAILQKEDVRFRSAVTTKYIKRYGVLEKVTKMQDGSTITTENLLWDSETGDVLATKTQNEFEEPIYQFSYPAHWVYDGMGMAYKNAGTHLTGIYFKNGLPYLGPGGTNLLSTYDDFITEGDEFGILRYPTRWGSNFQIQRLTAYKVPGGDLRFYTDNGEPFDSGTLRYDLTLIRSGRRNLQTTPVGTLVSKSDPTQYLSIQDFSNDTEGNQIVSANAGTFRDMWQRDCECTPEGVGAIPDTVNPYRNGMKGNWRPEHTYVNHNRRKAAMLSTSIGLTNIQKDGIIEEYSPFWDYTSSQWQADGSNAPDWIRQASATIYDFKGNQNEETDALGIYSMAQYGYQNNLNNAVAHNTQFRQGMYESFEDYTYNITPECDYQRLCDFRGHPLFNTRHTEIGSASPTDSIAHTGKYSYKVSPFTTYGMLVALDSSTNTTILTPSSVTVKKYLAGPNSCRPSFNPTPGAYLMSAWVFTGGTCDTLQTGPYLRLYQQHSDSNQFQPVYPVGPTIEGWRRIMGKVIVDANTGNLSIQLVNNTSAFVAYFDDIRFHPWLGNMKSYVYDPISLRLTALLDENNYATFYEYDDEGMLIRVKRETERGIMTIEEHRSALKH